MEGEQLCLVLVEPGLGQWLRSVLVEALMGSEASLLVVAVSVEKVKWLAEGLQRRWLEAEGFQQRLLEEEGLQRPWLEQEGLQRREGM